MPTFPTAGPSATPAIAGASTVVADFASTGPANPVSALTWSVEEAGLGCPAESETVSESDEFISNAGYVDSNKLSWCGWWTPTLTSYDVRFNRCTPVSRARPACSTPKGISGEPQFNWGPILNPIESCSNPAKASRLRNRKLSLWDGCLTARLGHSVAGESGGKSVFPPTCSHRHWGMLSTFPAAASAYAGPAAHPSPSDKSSKLRSNPTSARSPSNAGSSASSASACGGATSG